MVLHRARRGADVAGMARTGQHDADAIEREGAIHIKIPRFPKLPGCLPGTCEGGSPRSIESGARRRRHVAGPDSLNDTAHASTLNIAVKAARRAGQIINRASQDVDHLKVSSKRQNDFVTEVDRAAEDAIIGVLREAYPDHAILAEESARRPARQATANIAGSSIRSTAPPTSSTACRSTPCRSRWNIGA
jgi:hypothetical protein